MQNIISPKFKDYYQFLKEQQKIKDSQSIFLSKIENNLKSRNKTAQGSKHSIYSTSKPITLLVPSSPNLPSPPVQTAFHYTKARVQNLIWSIPSPKSFPSLPNSPLSLPVFQNPSAQGLLLK